MILVTGGTGFLGRNMLPILNELGYRVRLITRTPEDYPWLKELDVDIVRADIAQGAVIEKAAEGVQYVIHAAGLWRFWGKKQDFSKTNILGTRNLLQAAKRAGVEKFVHVSTVAVAGFPRNPTIVIDEDHPPNPVDDYQRTKLAGEQLVLRYALEHDLPAVIARGGAFYGPYGRYAFNKLFFEDPLLHKWPMGVDGGQHMTFPAYVKDVARGLLLCLEKGRPGEIYNISSQSMKQRDIEKLIAHISGTSPFRFHAPGRMMVPIARFLTWLSELTDRELLYVVTMRPYILGDWNVSIEKAQRELGYTPTPFEQGVRETLQWYVDAGLWKTKKGSFTDHA